MGDVRDPATDQQLPVVNDRPIYLRGAIDERDLSGDEAGEPRCQHVSPSPWGPTQCALPDDHQGRHAYSPSESIPDGGEAS